MKKAPNTRKPTPIQEPMDESGKFPFLEDSVKFPLKEGCCLAPTLMDPVLNFVKKSLKSVSTHQGGFPLSRQREKKLS